MIGVQLRTAPLEANLVTIEGCCCNGGMAWGTNCELCPTFESSK